MKFQSKYHQYFISVRFIVNVSHSYYQSQQLASLRLLVSLQLSLTGESTITGESAAESYSAHSANPTTQFPEHSTITHHYTQPPM